MRDQWQEYYRRGWWRRRTFLDDLGDAAAADPGKPAVVDHRADGGGRTVGYGELAAAVDRYAGALVDLGVEPGEIVAVQLPNWWGQRPCRWPAPAPGSRSARCCPSTGAASWPTSWA